MNLGRDVVLAWFLPCFCCVDAHGQKNTTATDGHGRSFFDLAGGSLFFLFSRQGATAGQSCLRCAKPTPEGNIAALKGGHAILN